MENIEEWSRRIDEILTAMQRNRSDAYDLFICTYAAAMYLGGKGERVTRLGPSNMDRLQKLHVEFMGSIRSWDFGMIELQ